MLKAVKGWIRKTPRSGHANHATSVPVVLSQPQSVYDALPGSAATLEVSLRSQLSERLEFSWKYCPENELLDNPESWVSLRDREASGRMQGVGTRTLRFAQLTDSDAGRYKCVVSNTVGSVESSPAALTVVTPPEIDCQPQDMKEAILQSEVSFSVRLHLPVRPVRSEASNTTTVERGSGTKGGEEEGGEEEGGEEEGGGVGKGEKGGGEKENGGGGEGEGGIAAADPQEGQKNYKGERKSGGSEGEGKTEATIVGTGESMWEKDLLFTWEMKRDRPSVLQNHVPSSLPPSFPSSLPPSFVFSSPPLDHRSSIVPSLLPPNSLDTSSIGYLSPLSPSLETPDQRTLREHHLDLRQYLNTDAILPYLSKHNLITADQLEELTLPVHTNTRKADLLMSWLPRSSTHFLERFIACLMEDMEHLAHAELAEKLKDAMERRKWDSDTSTAIPIAVTASNNSLCASSLESVWEEVQQEEGRVEGVDTAVLRILRVYRVDTGLYRCRINYKGCTVVSEPATLTVIEDGHIISKLLKQCLVAEDTEAKAAVDEYITKFGPTSRLAKKALVAIVKQETEHTQLISAFLQKGVPAHFMQNGMSPLHWACLNSHWRSVQVFILYGANKTAQTQDGQNAIHLVAANADNNSLQFLIHAGGEQLVNTQDKQGKTPLHLACERAKKIMPSKKASQDMREIKTVIQNLLHSNASLKLVDESGQTPLHKAAAAGHSWIVETILVSNPEIIDLQDKDLNTPLHIASALRWPEVVYSLLENGANQMIQNKDHRTPLALAQANGLPDIVDVLERKPGSVSRDRKQTIYYTDRHSLDQITPPLVDSHLSLKIPDKVKKGRRKSAQDVPSNYIPVTKSINILNQPCSPPTDTEHPRLMREKKCHSLSTDELSNGLFMFPDKPKIQLTEEQNVQHVVDTAINGYLLCLEGKKWLRQWCQLQTDCVLYIFKSQEDTTATTTLPLPGFAVETVRSTLTITLAHSRGKHGLRKSLRTETEEEFSCWVDQLERAVALTLFPSDTPSATPPSALRQQRVLTT